ncbi:MAG: cell division protein FtsA [Kiritimatiellae bacterium]|nr:cell division protein FtsA [Kiritimatiellia bacterium]
MTLDPIVVLDIGTSRVRALVAEENPDGKNPGRLEVTGYGDYPSAGICKGACIHIDDAAEAIRAAIKDASTAASVTTRAVHLPLTGVGIDSTPVHQELVVNGEIQPEHIEEIKAHAREAVRPGDALLHNVVRQYAVDGIPGDLPVGVLCKTLSLDALLIHGPHARLLNLVHVLERLKIELASPFFSGLCASISSLTGEQKRDGALLIDLGAGTTDFVAYANAQMADAGVLPVGGDQLTNDIAAAFHLPVRTAEALKRAHAQATLNVTTRTQRVQTSDMNSVKLFDLQQVANCRMTETFTLIRDRLRQKGLLSQLRAGVVLSGGGALLADVVTLASDIFELPAAIAEPTLPGTLHDPAHGPQMATILGAVSLAYDEQLEAVANQKTVWRGIKHFFGFS